MTLPNQGILPPDGEINRPNVVGAIGQEPRQAPTQPFQAYMKEAEPNPLIKTPQVSPFDLAHGQLPAAGPTMNTLIAQAVQAQS
ncbi:MAG TPA: hypothetical protein VLG76_02135, partial [Rhabdochlamydiaceae bacterium]|nr:hypothetical protein [Rhabdochlamydiaceae bacterium]